MQLFRLLFLFFIVFVTESLFIDERNDVTCLNGKCSVIRYKLYFQNQTYSLRSAREFPCVSLSCSGCAVKGHWSLSEISGKYFLSRFTKNCSIENEKHLSEMFPFYDSKVSEIQCYGFTCRKTIYRMQHNKIIFYSLTGNYSCNKIACRSCSYLGRWVLNNTLGRNLTITRSTNYCAAPNMIAMEDYFSLGGTKAVKAKKEIMWKSIVIGITLTLVAVFGLTFVQFFIRKNSQNGKYTNFNNESQPESI